MIRSIAVSVLLYLIGMILSQTVAKHLFQAALIEDMYLEESFDPKKMDFDKFEGGKREKNEPSRVFEKSHFNKSKSAGSETQMSGVESIKEMVDDMMARRNIRVSRG